MTRKSQKWYETMKSPAYRENMRKVALQRGYGKWMKGREALPQVREALLKATTGQNHWHFRGKDIRFWRKVVLKRDNYTCQICGLKDLEIMEVDHIKSKSLHPHLRYDPENLITVCPNCHRRKTLRDIKNKLVKTRWD